jgi:pyruvate kinase
MGSICAAIKSVQRDQILCEIQNEGNIYENSQITFSGSGEGGVAGTYGISREEMLQKDIRFALENDVDYIIHSVYEGK